MKTAFFIFVWVLPIIVALLGRKFKWKPENYLAVATTPGVIFISIAQDNLPYSDTANQGIGLLAAIVVGLAYYWSLKKVLNIRSTERS